MSQAMRSEIVFRFATADDVEALTAIEMSAFDHDRLNRRSFKRWIQAPHGILILAELEGVAVGYGLVWCHKGTRLARLYSLGVRPDMRGRGIAVELLNRLEEAAASRGHLYMRLEVAEHNTPAIRLYEARGYRVFGEYSDYYDDHSDALRMQKLIQQVSTTTLARPTPWYQQSTDFTCGPAALMMAMASLDSEMTLNQELEIDLWREATTIFMTAGHGGCHPLGLAIAAVKRGFIADVFINTDQPLFVEGVRSEHKKAILNLVHQQFLHQAEKLPKLSIHYAELSQDQIQDWLDQGFAVIALISTYRLDGKKTPHWVTVTNIDERCLYVHDPDLDQHQQLALDCQHLPIARDDFNAMTAFGSGRLRTAFAIKQR